MSLINDALKRASQSEKRRARDPVPLAPMQPAGRAWRASVPAEYTNSPYPLQYYFEAKESAERAHHDRAK